jgi:hypothetical protein
MFGFMLELRLIQQDGSMGDLFKDHLDLKASKVLQVLKVLLDRPVLKDLLALVFLMPLMMGHPTRG